MFGCCRAVETKCGLKQRSHSKTLSPVLLVRLRVLLLPVLLLPVLWLPVLLLLRLMLQTTSG